MFYASVFRSQGYIALQYWIFYSYDFWSGLFPPSDFVWVAHEGDWEVVTMLLTKAGRPLLAGYSQHTCGKRRPWAEVPRWQRTHPIVHVALGSHANFFVGRPHPVDLRKQCYPELAAAVLRGLLPGVLDYMGEGARYGPRQTRLVRVAATSPSWMAFSGRWGETSVFHVPEPIGTTLTPAPEGPRLHALWEKPVKSLLAWPRG